MTINRGSLQHSFARVPSINMQRSKFNRSTTHKTTLEPDYLVPFFLDEVLPGDTFEVDATLFARMLSPLKWAIMDNIQVRIEFFYSPNRLLWENFTKQMGEQADPDSSTDYLTPTIAPPVTGWWSQGLGDYFGLPLYQAENGVGIPTVISLPFRMYNLIWNQWYRDQNIQDSVVVDTGDGPDDYADYVLLVRNKRHDCFTSCLPEPQKGPDVSLPLGDIAPVVGNGQALTLTDGATFFGLGYNVGIDADTAAYQLPVGTNYRAAVWPTANLALGVPTRTMLENASAPLSDTGLHADLSEATAALINDLREMVALQHLYEMDARGGTRYVELLYYHFHVVNPDFRLQRVEYLGGSDVPFGIHPVTSSTDTSADGYYVGSQAAHAVGTSRASFVKSFTEHGWVMGLVSIVGDITYQRCLHRKWTRMSRLDYYWPAFANLGEQEVLASEVSFTNDAAANARIFGYQERDYSYRYFPNLITGRLRSDVPSSLDVWHLAQDFPGTVVLNSAFLQNELPIDRVTQITPSDVVPAFLLDCYIKNYCTRPMPVYSVPGLLRL